MEHTVHGESSRANTDVGNLLDTNFSPKLALRLSFAPLFDSRSPYLLPDSPGSCTESPSKPFAPTKLPLSVPEENTTVATPTIDRSSPYLSEAALVESPPEIDPQHPKRCLIEDSPESIQCLTTDRDEQNTFVETSTRNHKHSLSSARSDPTFFSFGPSSNESTLLSEFSSPFLKESSSYAANSLDESATDSTHGFGLGLSSIAIDTSDSSSWRPGSRFSEFIGVTEISNHSTPASGAAEFEYEMDKMNGDKKNGKATLRLVSSNTSPAFLSNPEFPRPMDDSSISTPASVPPPKGRRGKMRPVSTILPHPPFMKNQNRTPRLSKWKMSSLSSLVDDTDGEAEALSPRSASVSSPITGNDSSALEAPEVELTPRSHSAHGPDGPSITASPHSPSAKGASSKPSRRAHVRETSRSLFTWKSAARASQLLPNKSSSSIELGSHFHHEHETGSKSSTPPGSVIFNSSSFHGETIPEGPTDDPTEEHFPVKQATFAQKKNKRFANLLTRSRSTRSKESISPIHRPSFSNDVPTISQPSSNGTLRSDREDTQNQDITDGSFVTANSSFDRTKPFDDLSHDTTMSSLWQMQAAEEEARRSQRESPERSKPVQSRLSEEGSKEMNFKEHRSKGSGSVQAPDHNTGNGNSFLHNFKNTRNNAAKNLGRAGKGLFGRIMRNDDLPSRPGHHGQRSGRHGSSSIDDHYVCTVINLPLIEQVRKTRISKRLENSMDKTEYWMPALPWRCIDYLNFKGCEEEGLYRVPGSGKDVKHWQRRFDTEYDINLFDEPGLYDINTIGSMFKAWLRELPEEIFPRATQAKIAEQCAGATTAPQMLKDELSKLPPQHYYLLFAITCHLSLLHSYVDKNKMDYRNLCICFQPCMKIDSFCFWFLVCDWRNCWQGCWTEKEYLAIELEIEAREEEERQAKLLRPTGPYPLLANNSGEDVQSTSSASSASKKQETKQLPPKPDYGKPVPPRQHNKREARKTMIFPPKKSQPMPSPLSNRVPAHAHSKSSAGAVLQKNKQFHLDTDAINEAYGHQFDLSHRSRSATPVSRKKSSDATLGEDSNERSISPRAGKRLSQHATQLPDLGPPLSPIEIEIK